MYFRVSRQPLCGGIPVAASMALFLDTFITFTPPASYFFVSFHRVLMGSMPALETCFSFFVLVKLKLKELLMPREVSEAGRSSHSQTAQSFGNRGHYSMKEL